MMFAAVTSLMDVSVSPHFHISRHSFCLFLLTALFAATVHYLYSYRKFSLELECQHLFHTVVHEVCTEFQSHHVVGEFCPHLCSMQRQRPEMMNDGVSLRKEDVELLSCPDMDMHGGKEFVVALKFKDRKLVMKGKKSSIRDMMMELPVRQEAIHELGVDYYAAIINDSFVDFGPTDYDWSQEIRHLIPWNEPNGKGMNLSSWRTLSLLAQDSEFVTTRVMQNDHVTRDPERHNLFPSVISSCGHLYVTDFADEVLDSSFMMPSFVPLFSRPVKEKVDISVRLLRFLVQFVSHVPDRDMCDVKLHQFASLSSSDDQLVLIDSDMIYSAAFIRKSVDAVHSCKSNQECDFFDCRGICVQEQDREDKDDRRSICITDHQDNNVSRVCRNILFPFAFALFGTRVRMFGLFSDFYTSFNQEVSEIARLCELSSRETMLQNAKEILKIMEHIQVNV